MYRVNGPLGSEPIENNTGSMKGEKVKNKISVLFAIKTVWSVYINVLVINRTNCVAFGNVTEGNEKVRNIFGKVRKSLKSPKKSKKSEKV
jgi:predicted AlkP superfamily pyrophosphatase or phosphodiesterase